MGRRWLLVNLVALGLIAVGLITAVATPGTDAVAQRGGPGRSGIESFRSQHHDTDDDGHQLAQPAIVAYGSSSHVLPFAQEGALVVAGRDNYDDPAVRAVSDSGGTVLVYLDAIIDNSFGRYHTMLLESSRCGPAATRWPGDHRANKYGYLNDFRPGSIIARKLECVLERMVAENPHMGGFFADDLGSRSYFPGFSWDAFGATNQQDYRDGAIALSKTFRKVADRHGLLFMVNGTWGGGTLAESGGGYPDMEQNGNALADGTYAEKQSPDRYWRTEYPCASQWAEQSAVTKGTAVNFAVATNDKDRSAFASSGCYSYAATQNDYETGASVWTPFLNTAGRVAAHVGISLVAGAAASLASTS